VASEVAKRLRDRRMNVWNEAKGIAESAAEENRSFTPDEQGKWEALQEELGNIDTRLKAVLDTEKRAKEADDAYDELSGRKAERSTQQAGGTQYVEELRRWARGEEGSKSVFEVRRQAAGPVNYRVLTTAGAGAGTNASGIIPTDFYDQLIAYLIEVSGIMQCGPTVLNTGGGETLQIPKALTHTTATSAGQNASLPTADPTFTLTTLGAQKFGVLIQVARELIDDTAVDLLGYLAMSAGRALGNSFGTSLVNGTNGISGGLTSLAGATPAVTGGLTSAISGNGVATGGATYANLVDMEYSVIAPYRQSRSCYWLAADKTVGSFRKLTDNNGRPVWEPSAVLGAPDLLLGKPLVADPYMPAIGTSALSIAFGDFAQYFIRLVGGVRFERSDDFAFGSDLVTFRALLRGDGTLVDTNAIKMFKGGAS
jgi:HK97 family phage major capsid protein